MSAVKRQLNFDVNFGQIIVTEQIMHKIAVRRTLYLFKQSLALDVNVSVGISEIYSLAEQINLLYLLLSVAH